jgi:hypothetical protein
VKRAIRQPILSALLVATAALPMAWAPTALATWSDHADLIYDTAFTLDQGEFEVGVFSPLMYGINDRVQLSMHPILLLILSPHAGLRWQVTPTGPWTAALNLEGTWSFLEPVDGAGREVLDDGACDGCGFPGSVHAWPTLSWMATSRLLLTTGVGPRLDFLDLRHEDTALVTHGSIQWLMDTENLFMIHGTVDSRPWEGSGFTDPVIQLTYAHAWGMLHLALGVAIGAFEIVFEPTTLATAAGEPGGVATTAGDVETWPVFPVIDLFFRL